MMKLNRDEFMKYYELRYKDSEIARYVFEWYERYIDNPLMRRVSMGGRIIPFIVITELGDE